MSQPVVTLLGRLGRDPELKSVGDSQVAKFSVATDDKFVRGEEKRTIWFNVDVWGKRADWANQWLKKGSSVQVVGQLYTHEHEGKSYFDVNAFDVQFAGTKDATAQDDVSLESPAALDGVVNHAPVAAPPALDADSPF